MSSLRIEGGEGNVGVHLEDRNREANGTVRGSALWGKRPNGSRSSALWGKGGRGFAALAVNGSLAVRWHSPGSSTLAPAIYIR